MAYLLTDFTLDNKNCLFDIYRKDFSLYASHQLSLDNADLHKCFNGICVCYDVMKVLDKLNFDCSSLLFHDVKIIYELKGYKFENLVELGNLILGEAELIKYNKLAAKIKAHLTSYKFSKISIASHPENQLFPIDLLKEFYSEKTRIIMELYKRYYNEHSEELDTFYGSLYKYAYILHNISKSPLNIDLESIKDETGHFAKSIRDNTSNGEARLYFHIVGAKTGRLAFKKGTINVYGLPRGIRRCIVAPSEYRIVEFDFKSVQPRLAIMATNDGQFKDRFRNVRDIYSIFPGDRQKNKIDFLTWMYGNVKNEMFEKEASAIGEHRNQLYIRARNEGKIINKFGRILYWQDEEKNVVYQNFITSHEIDAIMLVMKDVYNLLKQKKSRIIFPFHDSLVCLIHKNEVNFIEQIKNLMEETLKLQFDSLFPVEIKSGKNYGEMI
jgi:hypothetical protein